MASSSVKFLKWSFYGSCVVGLAVLIYFVYLLIEPDVKSLATHNPASTSLMNLRAEQARKAKVSYSSKMIWKDLDEISPHLAHAVLLSEDDMFYQHRGFDLKEMREAVKINWRKKRYAYGASTLTQQLARTLYLSPKKNLLRKFKEALITVRLERALPKKRILEIYLNVVEWGRGIYGAEAAAQTYFDKPAADLTPDEAVALASVLPSPRRWSPVSEQGFMARRRTRLIARMRRAGYVPLFEASISSDTLVPFQSELEGALDLPLEEMESELEQPLENTNTVAPAYPD